MAYPLNPHFTLPFRLVPHGTGLQAAVVEQDSEDDVMSCVEAVVRYDAGQRIEKPSFGKPDPTFDEPKVDENELMGAILRWEPRAGILIQQSPDRVDTLIARVQVSVDARGRENV